MSRQVALYGYDATHFARFPMWRRRSTRLFRVAAAVLAEGPHMAAWAARAEAGRRQVAGKHDPDRLAGALENLYDSVRG